MMQALIAVVLMAAIGFVIISIIRQASELPDSDAVAQVQHAPIPGGDFDDEYDIDVEVIIAPADTQPTTAWESAIQKQLDAIEDRDPTNELVSVAAVHNRLLLFYKRRKVK